MVTRRIPLPLADEVNVLFGLPAATVGVLLGGALAAGFAYLHGGSHRWMAVGLVAAITLGLNVRWEDVPLYAWLGLAARFLLEPRVYVCPGTCVNSMEDEVTSHARAHAQTVSDSGDWRRYVSHGS